MKKLITLLLVLGVTASAFAAVHPNLIEAQNLLAVAVQKIDAAERANEFDMHGWAQKAKGAIGDARHEIQQATRAAEGRPTREVGALASVSPEVDVFFKRHPNLAEAQRYVDEAYRLIGEAQRNNGFDMEGHAQRAKDFLDRANEDIRKAAETANR